MRSRQPEMKRKLPPGLWTQGVLAFAACGTVLALGCGKPVAPPPPLGLVTGTVTLDGQPLPKASLYFVSTGSQGRGSNGVTNEAGRYELTYDGRHAGALIGSHRVEIRTGGEGYDKDGNFFETKERLPAKYHVQTKLTAEVAAGPNEINFDLKSR
jgi:hypothetical protein